MKSSDLRVVLNVQYTKAKFARSAIDQRVNADQSIAVAA
jgi:hypothetical protein